MLLFCKVYRCIQKILLISNILSYVMEKQFDVMVYVGGDTIEPFNVLK